MTIKSYDELSSMELDTLKEIGSIGTGNAATSLSALIGTPVRIQQPEVRIMGYNEAIEWIGGPEELGELEHSALTEVGNIMISTFITALSSLANLDINLTVPAFTVDMQGAIMAVPMAEYGGQSNYIMTIGGDFICNGKEIPCRLLLSPDIRSLNFMLRKLGVNRGE